MLIGDLFIVPAMPSFLAQNPEVKVDLLLSNRVVDLVEQNIDIDIRIGKLVDSSLVAKRLAVSERILCGAPVYFVGKPAIREPSDLTAHNCLTYRINLGRTVWRFLNRSNVLEEIAVAGHLQSDNGHALLKATRAGVGVSLMPDWAVRDDLASGRLTRLLPGYRISHIEFDNGVYAVYQKSRNLSAKVRVFLDFLAATLKQQ
jgi:DNA-binding transcriptional LysR family regulator